MNNNIFKLSLFFLISFLLLSPTVIILFKGLGSLNTSGNLYAYRYILGSAKLVFLVSFIIILISVPLAWVNTMTNFWGRKILQVFCILPLGVPAYISAYAYAELGKDMVRNYESDQINVNRLDYYLDRWTGPGTSNEVPRATTGATSNKLFSDFFVEDASFLRIQNIQLGYTLPSEVVSKAGISKFRLYASVNNAFTFTKYKGFDPAATSGNAIGGGIDPGFYPVTRQYLLGLNISF